MLNTAARCVHFQPRPGAGDATTGTGEGPDRRRAAILDMYTAAQYGEKGGSVTVSIGEDAQQPGLTLSLPTRWGAAQGASMLWQDQVYLPSGWGRRRPAAPCARRSATGCGCRSGCWWRLDPERSDTDWQAGINSLVPVTACGNPKDQQNDRNAPA